jgi:hypothetical protein
VGVIPRLLVVKHLYNWRYEQAEPFVADSITLRPSCRMFWASMPYDTTPIKWASFLRSTNNKAEHLPESVLAWGSALVSHDAPFLVEVAEGAAMMLAICLRWHSTTN